MKSLRNALKLLLQFSDDETALGVSELARRSGLTRSHASKLLAEFSRAGVLSQNPVSRVYSVGVRTYVLGTRFINQDKLARESIPIMRQLMDSTGHSARLFVMDGDRLLHLLSIEGPLFLDTGFRSGTWLPLLSTSAGRVLLAFMDPARSKLLLKRSPVVKLTEKTIMDRRVLAEMIEIVRNQGYAVQRGEATRDLGAANVPVFGPNREILASLGVALPQHLLTARVEAELVEQLHSAARGISLRMDALIYPFGPAPAALKYLKAKRTPPRKI